MGCKQNCEFIIEQVCCLECEQYNDCKFTCDTLDEIEYSEDCEDYIN